MALVYLSLSWLVGTYFGSRLDWPWAWLGGVTTALLLISLVLRRRRLVLALLSLALLFISAFRLQLSLPPEEADLAPYRGQQVMLSGKVEDIPFLGPGWQRLSVAVGEVKEGEREIPVEGTVLVWLPPLPQYHYGDRLVVSGRLEPSLTQRPRANTFGFLFYPTAKLLDRDGGDPMGVIHSLRLRLGSVLGRALPQPQAALAQGLLLGLRGDIPQELRDDFTQSGTIHILAISGLNMSIWLSLLLGLGAWAMGRHRPYYLLLAFVGLWLYVLLSGLQPPAVRAGIMGSLFLWGLWIGRPRSGLAALTVAAALMVGIEPGLLYQVSFQLSFAATAGLILIAPYFQAWGRKLSLPHPINDALAYSLGAIIASYPLMAHYFHLISLVGLPATLLATPVLLPIIVLSALVAVVGLVAMPLAQALGWLDWLFLAYFQAVAQAFASLPRAFVTFKDVPPLWLWAYYGVLGLALFRPRFWLPWLKEKAAWAYPRLPLRNLALALLAPTALVWIAYLTLPDARFHINFLDVGQGDAILLQQGGRQILVDGGPDPRRLASALDRRLPFWDRNLDGVVLTHPQADHLDGLLDVLRRYRVGWAMESGLPSPNLAYKEWRRLLEAKQTPIIQARAGQQIRLGPQAFVEVLHPYQEFLTGTTEDINNNAVVLRLEIGRVSFLLTGDIQQEAERELWLRNARLNSMVLKVAHHGSQTSTSQAFLAVVRPQVAIISVGPASLFGHPAPLVLERLRQMVTADRTLLTYERGSIELITDGYRLWVKTER